MITKAQEITLELVEKDKRLSVESLAIAIDNLVKVLRAVDSRMWTVGAPRYRWIVKSIQMNSPLVLTIEAVLTNEDAPRADVVASTFRGLGQLDSGRGKKPKFFDEESLDSAKRMVSVYGDGVLSMHLKAPNQNEIVLSSRIATSVERINDRKKTNSFDSYGSIEGFIRRVTLDDRPAKEQSELQIIDRLTDSLVTCVVTPDDVVKLISHIRHRVVLHGIIKYNHLHVPQRIIVESFARIDDGEIPSLEDIQSLGIKIDEDAGDYVSRLRGNDE